MPSEAAAAANLNDVVSVFLNRYRSRKCLSARCHQRHGGDDGGDD
jgi:hypothetical protein